jgi:hypothetical protein
VLILTFTFYKVLVDLNEMRGTDFLTNVGYKKSKYVRTTDKEFFIHKKERAADENKRLRN